MNYAALSEAELIALYRDPPSRDAKIAVTDELDRRRHPEEHASRARHQERLAALGLAGGLPNGLQDPKSPEGLLPFEFGRS